MTSIHQTAQHRRAVRVFQKDAPIDAAVVRQCLLTAQLAPTSSNMQLYETYHITTTPLLKAVAHTCFDQLAASTAQQLVVFVVRPDLYKAHAKAVVAFEKDNIKKTSPSHRIEARMRMISNYYTRLIPFLYARCCGLLGMLRKVIACVIGLFRPMLRQVSEHDLEVVMHKSCAIATGYFMLAMEEKGYATCPLEGYDSLRLRRLLHLPKAAQINMVIACGVASPKGIRGERFRLPFDEIYDRR